MKARLIEEATLVDAEEKKKKNLQRARDRTTTEDIPRTPLPRQAKNDGMQVNFCLCSVTKLTRLCICQKMKYAASQHTDEGDESEYSAEGDAKSDTSVVETEGWGEASELDTDLTFDQGGKHSS